MNNKSNYSEKSYAPRKVQTTQQLLDIPRQKKIGTLNICIILPILLSF